MEPESVVRGFLEQMARGDSRAALEVVDDNIVYTNVGLPTVHGRARVARVLGLLDRPLLGFGVDTINLASDGPVVLTERIDELRLGRLRVQFWVCGRFEVVDGRIVVWRDYFDQFDVLKGLVRAVAALAIPGLQKPLAPPVGPGTAPTVG